MATIEIEIEDELFLQLAKMAHERDITLNQLVTEILTEHIKMLEKEEEAKNA